MRYCLRMALPIVCLLAAVAAPPVAGPALAEKRVALSVGIDKYDNLPSVQQLEKAVADARAVGAALAELGFDTKVAENVSRSGFFKAWQKFVDRLGSGDTAVLFFAGHGVEIAGANYLVPGDVPSADEGERVLTEGMIRFSTLMADLRERNVKVSLFILDACRNNPFNDGRRRLIGGERGLKREEGSVLGSFILYSAGFGQPAFDRLSKTDADPNSPFTRTLIPVLKTPGLSLTEMARRVRSGVLALTAKQVPAFYDEVVEDVVLKPGRKAPDLPVVKLPPPPSNTGADGAGKAWALVQDSTDIAEVELFRKEFGAKSPFYDRQAEKRIEALQRQRLAMLEAEKERQRLEELAKVDPARGVKPGSGASFRDRTADGKACPECPELVVVPSGSFTMGSPEGEKDRATDEGPQRRVTIARALAVGKFEVTFDEWDACVAAGGCSYRPEDQGWGRGKRPVINVSWNDITQQYLPWLNRKTGKTYRLLTEAEWEYVARAGTSTPFWWGSSISPSQANYDGNYTYGGGPKGEYRRKTLPVDSFAPNPWGLYNVHGNVWEWVQDCYHDRYNGAPTDGSAWTTGDCSSRVFRGGSWGNVPRGLRAAYRSRFTPDIRNFDIGFRLGRTF